MKDSGIAWIGSIPVSWDLRRLKACFLQRDGGAWGDEAAGDNGSVTIGGFEVGKDYIKANITDSEFGDAEFSLHTDPQSGEAIKIVGLNK
jgi:hypothetical protein